MAERCGCYDQGDDIVFGPRHQCTAKPALTTSADLPRFIPSWRFVVPETSEGEPGIRVISCTPPPVGGVAADNLQQELDRLERDDPAVATASAGLDAVYEHLKGRLPSPLVAEIYDLERPYERVLGPDELED
jgi:hypothetical protein